MLPWIPVSGPSTPPLPPLRHQLQVMPRLLLPWTSMTTGLSPRRSTHRMIPVGLRLLHRLPVVAVAAVRRHLLTMTLRPMGLTQVTASSWFRTYRLTWSRPQGWSSKPFSPTVRFVFDSPIPSDRRFTKSLCSRSWNRGPRIWGSTVKRFPE